MYDKIIVPLRSLVQTLHIIYLGIFPDNYLSVFVVEKKEQFKFLFAEQFCFTISKDAE